MRPVLIALIALGVVLFVVVSALLARVFSIDGAERAAITTLVRAEARGDATGMAGQLTRCQASAACRSRVVADVAAMKRPGAISILQIQPSAGFSLGTTQGIARVAWSSGASLPIVQCVRVRRAGNVLSGLRVELLAISARIKTDGACSPALL